MSDTQYYRMINRWSREVGDPKPAYAPPAYIADQFPEVRDLYDQYTQLVEKLDELQEQFRDKLREPERQVAEITNAVLAGKKPRSEKSENVLHAEALALLEAGKRLRRQINEVSGQLRQWAVEHRAELLSIIAEEELPTADAEVREAWAAFASALAKRDARVQHRKDVIDAFLSLPRAPKAWIARAKSALIETQRHNEAYLAARKDMAKAAETLATLVNAFDVTEWAGDPFTSDVVAELDRILREDEERRALQPLSPGEANTLRRALRKLERGQDLSEQEARVLERRDRIQEARRKAAEEAAKRRASSPSASRVWVFGR